MAIFACNCESRSECSHVTAMCVWSAWSTGHTMHTSSLALVALTTAISIRWRHLDRLRHDAPSKDTVAWDLNCVNIRISGFGDSHPSTPQSCGAGSRTPVQNPKHTDSRAGRSIAACSASSWAPTERRVRESATSGGGLMGGGAGRRLFLTLPRIRRACTLSSS